MTLRINLALQGGGAHGAFTWGVLDRLLEDDDLEIAAISGTSAGALNGAALKIGLATGGREAAKASLDLLWLQIGATGDPRVNDWVRPWMPYVTALSDAVEQVFPVSPQGILAQVLSPYSYGPLWQNPLERVVRRFVFPPELADVGPRLFIGATNVRTGKIRIFSGSAVGPDALLASACVPTVFQAIVIPDPETGVVDAYWDGGFTGNPALFPLYEPDLPDDIVIVSVNPIRRDAVPDSPLEIQNRINEVSFNASLMGELRAIAFVKRLIAEGRMERGVMKDVQVHMIADDVLMNRLSASTKLLPNPFLIAELKAAGRVAAETFLTDHRGKIGRECSTDLKGLFS